MGDVQDVVRDTERPKLHFVRLCINGNRMKGRVNGQSGERWAMGDNTLSYITVSWSRAHGARRNTCQNIEWNGLDVTQGRRARREARKTGEFDLVPQEH